MPAIITTEFPAYTEIEETAFLGQFTVTLAKSRLKFIDSDIVIPVEGVEAAPTEWARTYLLAKFGGRPIRRTEQIFAALHPVRIPPTMSLPGAYPDMVYTDLVAAYWSLLQVIGWDTDYWPGRYWGKGDSMRDWFLPHKKDARNMLVSVSNVSSVCMWINQRVEWRKFANPLANAPMWAAIQDVLHAVAAFAVRLGAVYVHTDGYIMPRRAYEAFAERLLDFGLSAAIKYEGDCHVYGVGRYQFPKSRLLADREKKPGTIYTIRDVPAEWLFPRLAAFAASHKGGG